MPFIISRRDQLLTYIAGHVLYRFIARAMSEGVVEHLGAFNIKGNKGWITRVQTLAANRVFYVGTSAVNGKYRVLVTDVEPSWKYWVGGEKYNDLYCGDNPDRYIELREKELEHAKT